MIEQLTASKAFDMIADNDLLRMIFEWTNQLQATKYYLRYENASWEFADEGDGAGVILTSDTKIV